MAEITEERLVEIVQGTYCGFDEGVAIAAELLAARAELRRMSEWHDEIADALRAEVERLRADLREAVELLRTSSGPGYTTWLHLEDATDWNTRYGALLAKHKET